MRIALLVPLALAASAAMPRARLAAQATTTTAPAARAADAPAAARVDRVFARIGKRAEPGCAVAVAQGGRTVLSRAYGMADLEHGVPNRPETIFEAGSVTKQVTAAAVVLLALDGKLTLDDDVRRHLPELPDYGTPITIRHLLNHTSGLRDWGSVADLGGWPRTTRVYTNDIVLDIVRRQWALNYSPGQYYSYTNSGYNLLAIIVGRVAGVPLAEFTRTRLFTPLGMANTSWRDDYRRVVPGRAVAYDSVRGAADGQAFRLDMPFENAHGNGGLLTTVGDLLRWTANLETGRVGGPRFLAEMHQQARLTDGRQIEYASGLYVTRYRGVREVSHSGSTAGYRAWLGRYPAQRLAVALLCNDAGAPTERAHEVADAYLGGAVAPATPVTPVTPVTATPTGIAADVAAARAGSYRDTRTGDALRLAAVDGQLRIDGGTVLVPRSSWAFQAGSTRTLVFDSTAAVTGPAPFAMLTADGDSRRYEPVAEFRPSAEQLAAVAGAYSSDEAEATYTVRVEGGTLHVRDRYGPDVALRPLYEDAYRGADRLFRFVRDTAGRVAALDVGNSRAWRVRFVRQP